MTTTNYEVVDTISIGMEVEQQDNTTLGLSLKNLDIENARVGLGEFAAQIEAVGAEKQIDVAVRLTIPEADVQTKIEGDENTVFNPDNTSEEVPISGDFDVDLTDHVGNAVTVKMDLLAKRFWE
jgi:hypothetical protein